jgi:hypothetical protein
MDMEAPHELADVVEELARQEQEAPTIITVEQWGDVVEMIPDPRATPPMSYDANGGYVDWNDWSNHLKLKENSSDQ